MRRLPVFVLLVVVLFAAVTLAAFAADARRGAELARRWCVSCHATGTGPRAPDAGPPFAAIAADPAYTDGRLKGWLADPHPPMPNLNLGRGEIEDLVAYIRGLKPR